MSHHLKIGELANITGITVRTLHYYDEIGLLKPVKITQAGHRSYDMQSITKLYQIISINDLCFNIEEINEIITVKNIDVLELIKIQISSVEEEIGQKQLLLSKLYKLKEKVGGNEILSMEDFRDIAPFINISADTYLTDEQYNKLKSRLETFDAKEEPAEEWLVFITKLKHCYENELPKTNKMARECVEYWQQITNELIGDDEQIEKSILSFYASQSGTQLNYGLTDELYQYLMTLM